MAKAIDATVEGIEGTIIGFRGSRDSRIAYLVVDGVHVPCDNVATAKCLHACFGNFIVNVTPMMRMLSSVNASGTRWMILRYLMA